METHATMLILIPKILKMQGRLNLKLCHINYHLAHILSHDSEVVKQAIFGVTLSLNVSIIS